MEALRLCLSHIVCLGACRACLTVPKRSQHTPALSSPKKLRYSLERVRQIARKRFLMRVSIRLNVRRCLSTILVYLNAPGTAAKLMKARLVTHMVGLTGQADVRQYFRGTGTIS